MPAPIEPRPNSVQSQTTVQPKPQTTPSEPSLGQLIGQPQTEGQEAPEPTLEDVAAPQPQAQPQFQAQTTALLQALAAEKEQKSRYEEYLINHYISQLPSQQQAYAKQVVAYNRSLQQQQQQTAQVAAYAQQLENAFLPIVKDKVFATLSQKHQIEKELIAKYAETPSDAEKIIKALTDYRKKAGFEVRKTQGNDMVPAGGAQTREGVSNPLGTRTNHPPELLQKYRHTGNLSGYIRERMAAGTW